MVQFNRISSDVPKHEQQIALTSRSAMMHVFFGDFMWRLLKSFSPELDFISDSDKKAVIVGGSFIMNVI